MFEHECVMSDLSVTQKHQLTEKEKRNVLALYEIMLSKDQECQ